LDADFLNHIPDSDFNAVPVTRPYQDTRDVAQRAVGSFFGWMRANDGIRIEWTGPEPKLPDRAIMHCCTANGARTLYFVHDSIVTREADEVRVNLLLNRASPWVDVDSYLPAAGKVVLHIKDAARVAVRMPEWSDPLTVRVQVGEQPRRAVAEGRWVKVGWLRPGDRVTLTFPVPERTVHRVIGEVPYKLVLRGSNVVSINPGGVGCPLYERQPRGRLIQKTRFVPRTSAIIW
ncbi:MAG: hypothetical protein ABIG68_09360, partial [Acidobacteriota bacterium]